MPRNVNTIPASWFHGSTVPHWEFVHMYWPAPVNDLRWTNYGDGTLDTFDADMGDEGTVTWDCTKVFTIGQIETGDQSPLAISDISFGNADNSFSDVMRQYTHGTQGVKIDIWSVAYAPNGSPPPDFAPIDRMKVFTGVMDRAEVGDDVRVSLQAFRVPLSIKYPRNRYSLAYGYKFIPPPNFKMKFGTTFVTLPTPKTPVTPPPGGGLPGSGPPGSIGSDPVARMPIVRIDPSGRNRTSIVNRRGGRQTQVVPR